MRVAILGAGLTGLSTAWKLTRAGLGHQVTVIEQRPQVGGLAGSFLQGPYMLDYGPHRFYTTLPNVFDDIRQLMGDHLQPIPKKLGFNLHGELVDFPVSFTDLLRKAGVGFTWKAGSECLRAMLRGRVRPKPDTCYQDFLLHRFGPTISAQFFEPLARKTWGDPTRLDAHLARSRVLPPDLVGMLRETLGVGGPTKAIEHFYYTRESIGEIGLAMRKKIEQGGGQILCDSKPISITLDGTAIGQLRVETPSGERDLPVDFLVSTIPLDVLLRLFRPLPDSRVLQTAEALEYADLILAYFVVKRSLVLDYAWVYYPDEDIPFSRLMDKRRFSSSGLPDNRTVLCAEVNPAHHGSLADDGWLQEKLVSAFEQLGIVVRDEIEDYFTVRLPRAYPLYHIGFRTPLRATLDYCRTVNNLLTVGRHGLFNYSNMDHAMDMGAIAADIVHHGGQGSWTWEALLHRTEEYRIYG